MRLSKLVKTGLPKLLNSWSLLSLLLILLLWTAEQSGYLDPIKHWQLKRLYGLQPQPVQSKSVLRLSAELNDKNYSALSALLQNYPQTPVALMGNASPALIDKLQSDLISNPALRQSGVLLVTAPNFKTTENAMSVQGLPTSSAPVVSYSDHSYSDSLWQQLHQDLFIAPLKVSQRVSRAIIYSPFILDASGRLTILGEQNGLRLTATGELIRQQSPTASWQLQQTGKALQLSDQDKTWRIGLDGTIWTEPLTKANANRVPTASLTDFLSQPASQSLKLILVDDSAELAGQRLALAMAQVFARHYRYQNLTTLALEWFSLFLVIWLLIKFREARPLTLVTLSLVLFTAVLLLQWALFTLQLWLDTSLTLLLVLLVSALLLLRKLERQKTLQQNQNYQSLFARTLSLCYENQRYGELNELLIKSPYPQDIMRSVTSLAERAHDDGLTQVAETLDHWLFRHSPEKARQLAAGRTQEPVKPLKLAGSWEKTLVIHKHDQAADSRPIQPLAIPRFGRYQVESVLGQGAMGVVYQGVDPKINRHVAIKTLHLSLLDERFAMESKQRFFREAETAGNLHHPNIVTIYDVGEQGDLGYIAMDLLTGAPLSAFTQPPNLLPPALVFQLMIQVADALDYAHQQKVVHRDIKPANLIFDDELQRVTITDFGIAHASDNSQTKTGTIVGSPNYMSPEQIMGKVVDGRSDIFSLGTTLYQLLSGQLPFHGDSIATVAYHITQSKPIPLNQLDASLPASATRITGKAMHKEIDKRFQTMQEFKQALVNTLKRDFKQVGLS